MLVDHIGSFLFPKLIFLRVLGRLSLPLFAYQFVVGFRNTSDPDRYFKRLTLFALISQIPYQFLTGFDSFELNILFTFLFSFVVLMILKKKGLQKLWVLLILPIFLWCSYSYYGLALILLIYYVRKWNIGFVFLNLIYVISTGVWVQFVSVFSYPLIGCIDRFVAFYRFDNLELKNFKYFFYLFYPAHLAVILMIRLLFF